MSLWKPVIWRYNFPNLIIVERSSRNVKFDSYKEKENPLFFTFNVIKLVSFWHRISGFLFMVRVNAVFFYFMIIIRHKERQRLCQHGHKNGHFNYVYFNFVICEIRFLKSMFWNNLLKIVALCSPGYNFFYFEVHIPPTHSSAKYVFSIYHPPIVVQNMFFSIYHPPIVVQNMFFFPYLQLF